MLFSAQKRNVNNYTRPLTGPLSTYIDSSRREWFLGFCKSLYLAFAGR